MPKIILTVLLLAVSSLLFSQYVIFSENMGNTPVSGSRTARGYEGFENYGKNGIVFTAPTGSFVSVVNSSGSSSGYETASGGNFVNIAGNTSASFGIENINITGASQMVLSFGVSKLTIAQDGHNLKVDLTAGGNTVSFTPVLPTGSGTTGWHYVTSTVEIPTGTSLNILFTNTTDTSNSQSLRIDDVRLTSATPLPVSFGPVSATCRNDLLTVDWTTYSEQNNSHFVVEASADAHSFSAIATVASKAAGKESATPLKYSVSVSYRTLAALAIPALFLLFVPLFRQKRQSLLVCGVLVFMAAAAYSCTKSGVAPTDENRDRKWVRVAQVDQDGKTTYSKPVVVVFE